MIEITPHARKRMEERGITIEQVEETVQNPEETIEVWKKGIISTIWEQVCRCDLRGRGRKCFGYYRLKG